MSSAYELCEKLISQNIFKIVTADEKINSENEKINEHEKIGEIRYNMGSYKNMDGNRNNYFDDNYGDDYDIDDENDENEEEEEEEDEDDNFVDSENNTVNTTENFVIKKTDSRDKKKNSNLLKTPPKLSKSKSLEKNDGFRNSFFFTLADAKKLEKKEKKISRQNSHEKRKISNFENLKYFPVFLKFNPPELFDENDENNENR